MNYLIFVMLLILFVQLILIYLVVKDKKVIINKREKDFSVLKSPKYEDLDPNYKLLFNALESIKLEKWNFKYSFKNDFYKLTFSKDSLSLVSKIKIINVRKDYFFFDKKIKEISIVYLKISDYGRYDTIDIDISDIKKSDIEKDIINFFWKYLESEKKKENKKLKKALDSDIEYLNSKFKAGDRNNKLKSLLKDE